MMTSIIDENGYRLNVGIIIASDNGQVFWGRRLSQREAWQFPQGGMMPGETPEQALYRELQEEVGLGPQDVDVIAVTRDWLRYRVPPAFLRRRPSTPHCIGQKQKWFLLKLLSNEDSINLAASASPEFQDWRWVDYWYPSRNVVSFKRQVYCSALQELHPALKQISGTDSDA